MNICMYCLQAYEYDTQNENHEEVPVCHECYVENYNDFN